MRWFWQRKKKPEWVGPMGVKVNDPWWKLLVDLYRKDVDINADPEKDAQAIYLHWIHSYLSK